MIDEATRPTGVTEGERRRSRERTPMFWVLDALLVLIVVLVLVLLVGRNPRPAEDAFLDGFRHDYPDLSLSDAQDGRLLDAARAACTTEGLSAAEVRWLRGLDVDVDAFRDEAQDLCPSR